MRVGDDAQLLVRDALGRRPAVAPSQRLRTTREESRVLLTHTHTHPYSLGLKKEEEALN